MLTLTENRQIAVETIVEIEYEPERSAASADPGKGPHLPQPSSLQIELMSGESLRFCGEEAERVWRAYKAEITKTG